MKYLVVGSPVGHSLSPAMMNAAFRSAGIDAVYEAREIPPERWPAAMAELHREGIAGANVTVPLKEATLDGARWINPNARSIGAANTLLRGPGGWRVDNTDGTGFHRWIVELGLGLMARGDVLILGAGGSARAVAWAFRDAGARIVRIANRTRERAEAIARLWDDPEYRVEAPGGRAPRGGIVVNCTSLGLRPDDPLPIAPEALRGAGQVLDLVYPETPLVRAARELGIPAEHGLGMLVHQGCHAFELWTGKRPDRKAMFAAAEAELARRGK